jgi:hypothetical protein
MPAPHLPAASVAAASTTGAAALGVLARAGRVPARLRRLHHVLYLVGVVATALSVRPMWRTEGRLDAVVALGVLATLPRTRPGSARHVAVGTAAVTAVLTMRMSAWGGRRCG